MLLSLWIKVQENNFKPSKFFAKGRNSNPYQLLQTQE